MHKSEVSIRVAFGDCDPAGIVFYPNFYRWFDVAGHQLFESAGLSLHSIRPRYGVVGFPLVETGAQYRLPATVGDHLRIESRVEALARKTIRLAHRVMCGDALICEGFEVRFMGAPHPSLANRLVAIELPAEVRAALE